MLSYFEPNFLEKFLWESGFSNFGQNQNDAKQKSVITHMVQISLQNSGGKVVFYAWVPRNPPLGTNGGKSTLVT